MTTPEQFLKALAVVESSDDPEAWGDAGRAMGRWQVHPDRLWYEAARLHMPPQLNETWDQWCGRIVRRIFEGSYPQVSEASIAMYWHKQKWTTAGSDEWDLKYAARFGAALANAVEDLP